MDASTRGQDVWFVRVEKEKERSFRERLQAIDARMREALATPEHEEAQRRIAASLDAQAAEEWRLTLSMRGIPAAFRDIVVNPEPTEAMAAARLFVKGEWQPGDAERFEKQGQPLPERPLVLLLAGQLGRGKTVAACWVIGMLGGRYAQMADLVEGGWFDASGMDELRRAPVLALDEVGMEPRDEKGWVDARIYRLLDRRIAEGRRTVLATNLGGEAFKARYGSGEMAKLWDRLSSTWSVPPRLKGESFRKGGIW